LSNRVRDDGAGIFFPVSEPGLEAAIVGQRIL